MSPDTQTQEPAASPGIEPAEAAPPAQAPTGESGAAPPDAPEQQSSDMDDWVRGIAGKPTSKPADPAPSGESTPSGDVKPGESTQRGPDGRFLPRRAIPEALRSAEQEITDLKRQLAERDPETLRQQWEAGERQRAEREAAEALAQSEVADAERYERLNALPDDHPELAEGDNYAWLQEYKRVLSLSPKAEKQHRALAERRVAAAEQAFLEDRERFLGGMRSEMSAIAGEYGVDPEAWKRPGTTWASMTRDAAEARAAPLEARIRELEADLGHHARLNGPSGLGAQRAPVGAGRSSAGSGPPSMDDWVRGRLVSPR